MGSKKIRPVTPGMRGQVSTDFKDITKKKPEKSLLQSKKSSGGRNNKGRITSRHRGGGHKQKYRVIDFKRIKDGIPARVAGIEYDPNRSAFIALINYSDNEKRYIIAQNGLKVGQSVISGDKATPEIGNAMPVSKIPLGTIISCIELNPGKGASISRSAGSFAQLMAKDGKYVTIKLPSGETRMILNTCYATIGAVSNSDNQLVSSGKAGRKRWLGIRPRTRPVAMNPVDHPHGGGEGRTSGGRNPVTPWGVSTKGKKTRNNKKTNVFIIKRRKK